MATDVNSAFRTFLSETVNLDPGVVSQARSSRDWLLEQINGLPGKYGDFPEIYVEQNMHYGSFARGTKIRELDDIDLIITLKALGTTYIDSAGILTLTVPDGIALRSLCFDGTNQLNSRKVINQFVSRLSDVPQYQRAEIKRTGEAAVLNLSSYLWNFDIVPAFFTTQEGNGRDYYVIPDGDGNWKKTDPRKDKERLAALVQNRGVVMLDALRLTKYWNKRSTVPGMPSYLIECMVLNYYDSNTASEWPDIELIRLLDHIKFAVHYPVSDPKGIQGNLNTLSHDECVKISERAAADAENGRRARDAERASDPKMAIDWWGKVLGPAFPSYC